MGCTSSSRDLTEEHSFYQSFSLEAMQFYPGGYNFEGWYILLTPSPWTTPVDLVHGLLEWTTLNGPLGICGKHKFKDARTPTKDAIDRQTQIWNTCNLRDLKMLNN